MEKSETRDEVENINKQEAAQQEQAAGNNDADNEAMEDGDVTLKLQEELEQTKDKYVRLYSEFENFRRRTAKEKLELIQTANEQLITSLLPVVDDFDRAESAVKDKTSSDVEGFFLINSKLRKILETYGVKPMDVRQGSEFDSDFQEAVSQIPAPSPELRGKIVDVVEKGYLLNDKVIRYAKVVVGN